MNQRLLPSPWRALWLTASIAFRASPWLALGSLMIPVGWIQGQVVAVATRFAVDGLASHRMGVAAAALVVLVAIRVAWEFFNVLGSSSIRGWQDRASVAFGRRLGLGSAALPGLAEFEDPAILDLLQILRSDVWMLHWTFESLMEALGAMARFLLTSVLLATLDPRLLILPLAGLPALWAGGSSDRLFANAQERTAQAERRRRHLFEMATGPASAKEVRVNRLGPFLRLKSESAWREIESVYRSVQQRAAAMDAAGALVVSAAFIGAVLLMLQRARSGQATPGAVLMTVMLGGEATGILGMLTGMVRWTLGNLRVSRRFVWLLDSAEKAAASAGKGRPPQRLQRGIRLREVTFSYGPNAPPALDRITLDLPAGSVLAIVGDNGAGKSSLVKLLCRFYEPDAGRIDVDGVDLREINRDAWRRRIAPSFQDFCRFESVLRESVGVGNLARIKESTSIGAALHGAGASRIARRFQDGAEHQLGTRWPGGSDLSTGEWQKVALARMLMREAPLLVVLDEPSASLDAPAEAALLEHYAAAAREAGRRNGAITILVSHRFSTVRAADHIIVLDRGRMLEQGSHQELVAAGGHYGSLVTLQRRLHGG